MAIKETAELAKKQAEAAKKLEQAKRKAEIQNKMVESRIKSGEALGTKLIDAKYANKEVERRAKELSRLK